MAVLTKASRFKVLAWAQGSGVCILGEGLIVSLLVNEKEIPAVLWHILKEGVHRLKSENIEVGLLCANLVLSLTYWNGWIQEGVVFTIEVKHTLETEAEFRGDSSLD